MMDKIAKFTADLFSLGRQHPFVAGLILGFGLGVILV